MKWIKASERLPLFSHKLISRFIHTQTPMFDFRDWALNNPDKLHLVEWLDESASLPSSSVTGEEELKHVLKLAYIKLSSLLRKTEEYPNEETLIIIEKALDGNISLPVTGESEAIEMIKWIRENYEPEFGDGRHWEDILDEAETPISDKELYNLYKQSKK